MKLLAILTVFVALAYTSVNALPAVYDGPLYEMTKIEDPVYDDEVPSNLPHIRQRRVTCDLLSIEYKGLKINDAACAANCLRQIKKKFRGGHCKNGVCVCRK